MNNSKIRLKFKGSCLKQEDKAASIPKKRFIYCMYTWSRDLNTDINLKFYLFGAVKLTKNADQNKYKYSGYGIGFDSRLYSSLLDSSMGRNATIFGADMS